MAKNAITVTVGTTEVVIDQHDLSVALDCYVVVASILNTADVWVNLDPAGTTTTAASDNHVPIRPGEPVDFDFVPLKMISTVAGQTVTVGKY